jgi:hypothetical protein
MGFHHEEMRKAKNCIIEFISNTKRIKDCGEYEAEQ